MLPDLDSVYSKFGISCAGSFLPCGGFVSSGLAKREPDVASRMKFCLIPPPLWRYLTSYRSPILHAVCPNLLANLASWSSYSTMSRPRCSRLPSCFCDPRRRWEAAPPYPWILCLSTPPTGRSVSCPTSPEGRQCFVLEWRGIYYFWWHYTCFLITRYADFWWVGCQLRSLCKLSLRSVTPISVDLATRKRWSQALRKTALVEESSTDSRPVRHDWGTVRCSHSLLEPQLTALQDMLLSIIMWIYPLANVTLPDSVQGILAVPVFRSRSSRSSISFNPRVHAQIPISHPCIGVCRHQFKIQLQGTMHGLHILSWSSHHWPYRNRPLGHVLEWRLLIWMDLAEWWENIPSPISSSKSSREHGYFYAICEWSAFLFDDYNVNARLGI